MTKKTFIVAIASISIIALALTLFIIFFQGGNREKVGNGEVYEIQAEDRISADAVLRDFVSRSGNFGLIVPNEASDEVIAHTVYDFSVAIGSSDFSYLFLTRAEANKQSANIISEASDVYPFSSLVKKSVENDFDVFGYRSYSSTVGSLNLPSSGVYQDINDNEKLPSIKVEIKIESTVKDRKASTLLAKDSDPLDPAVNAAGWNILERSKVVSQTFSVQLVKGKSGWLIYRVNKPTYPEVLSVFPTNNPDHEILMTGASSKSYEMKFDKDEKHEHN